MQNDLISRKAVIEIIHKEIERTLSFAEHETQINIEMAVEELPTAYDVEKVVAELEEIYDRFDKGKKEAYEDKDWELFDLFMHRNEGIYIALTIVRNGRKE